MSAPGNAQRPPTRFRFLLPFSIHVFNRFARHFIHWLPYFAIIGYRGRKSGKRYRTPINVFRDGEIYVFALTYGSGVQWVRNVLAAGEADLQIRNQKVALTDPVLFVDPTRHLTPLPIRIALGFARVSEFMRMRPVPNSRPGIAE